jgi:hypothetical protein
MLALWCLTLSVAPGQTTNTHATPAPPSNPVVNALLVANPAYQYNPRSLSVDEAKGIISIHGCATPFDNIQPLATVDFCTDLTIHGCKVSSLEPIRKFKLTRFDLGDCPVNDLSPIQGMPITYLIVYNTGVKSLEPLRGMPLQVLHTNAIYPSFYDVLSSLTTLKELESAYCKYDPQQLVKIPKTLTSLGLIHIQLTDGTPVDLASFQEQPLTSLQLLGTPITNWDIISKFHHLKSLSTDDPVFDNFTRLKGLPIETLTIKYPQPSPLTIAGIQALPLKELTLQNCLVNLNPLAGSPLQTITFSAESITGGLDALKSCPAITSVVVFFTDPSGQKGIKHYAGATAVDDFFKDVAAGTMKIGTLK